MPTPDFCHCPRNTPPRQSRRPSSLCANYQHHVFESNASRTDLSVEGAMENAAVRNYARERMDQLAATSVIRLRMPWVGKLARSGEAGSDVGRRGDHRSAAGCPTTLSV